MKSVLISIRPKWCELIAKGKKTIEVRKTRPKAITPPFKVYIYQTKDFKDGEKYGHKTWARGGKVIGEFVCRFTLCFFGIRDDHGSAERTPCKVLYGIARGEEEAEFKRRCCLSHDELFDYTYSSKDHVAFGWYISDLKIYDKPKALEEFHLSRPPQSWCYVEEAEK